MLIMMYAHARVSGDGTFLAQHVCRTNVHFWMVLIFRIVQHFQAMGRLSYQQYVDIIQPVRLVQAPCKFIAAHPAS